MVTQRPRILALVAISALALMVGACTRSASTPPPSEVAGAQAEDALSSQQATMEAVRAALLTQTAQASEGGSMGATATPEPTKQSTPATPGGATATPTVAAATPTPAAGDSGPVEYTVLPGEWVYSIARKFSVDPQAIIDLNNLAPPYTVYPGQVLQIPSASSSPEPPQGTALPGGTTYTVLPGEWVYSIARKFGIDPQDIIDANNLQYPYILQPGDELIIP